MRRYLAYILILIIAVMIGLEIVKDPGYALFSYQQWTVELPLWLLAFIIIILFAILMFIIRAFDNTRFLMQKMAYWRQRRNLLKMQRKTDQGMLELLEGRFKAAEQHLQANTNSEDTPIMNYLSAAQAANALGAYDRRDVYLSKAKNKEPNAEIAVLIIKAQLQLEQTQLLEAEHTLERLHKIAPKHETVLNLMQTLYRKQENWQGLLNLLPKLKKYKVINAQHEETLTITIQQHLLEKSADPKAHWHTLSRYLRKEASLINTYAHALVRVKEDKEAEDFIHHQLKKQWSDVLCELYGNLSLTATESQLHHAEKWLKKQPDNPVILSVLGKLCMQCNLWGRARTYFTNSLDIKPTLETYKQLGALLEQIGESNAALKVYKDALKLK